ncbi:hypothetical protein [Nostoc sp. NMS7]|nr:hypothetical protein [Nostoc sp. NMS7]
MAYPPAAGLTLSLRRMASHLNFPLLRSLLTAAPRNRLSPGIQAT